MVFTYILYLFVYARASMHTHVHIHPWHVFTCHSMDVTEDNLWELALFFHHGDPMAQTRGVRL